MCRTHLFPLAPLDETCLLADSVRFGKGLQLVNILRDLPADLRQGRCYLPELELGKHGLKPSDLLKPQAQPAFRPYYESLLDRAESHLRAGWGYTNQLPRGCVRVRLVCAWPILIGVQTLARLRQQKILNASERIKISRADVRGIVLRTLIAYPWRGVWDNLFVGAASR